MRCSKCGVENRQAARFCDGCGAPISVSGASSPPDEKASVRFIIANADPDLIDGERKTVSALFADIKGSMELMEDLDPEELGT